MWCSDICCLRVTVSTRHKQLHLIENYDFERPEQWKRENVKPIPTTEMKNKYIWYHMIIITTYYPVQYRGYHGIGHIPRRNPRFLTEDFLGHRGLDPPRIRCQARSMAGVLRCVSPLRRQEKRIQLGWLWDVLLWVVPPPQVSSGKWRFSSGSRSLQI